MVQWLGLGALTAEGPGSIPGWGTKILLAVRCGQKKCLGVFPFGLIYIYIYIFPCSSNYATDSTQ